VSCEESVFFHKRSCTCGRTPGSPTALGSKSLIWCLFQHIVRLINLGAFKEDSQVACTGILLYTLGIKVKIVWFRSDVEWNDSICKGCQDEKGVYRLASAG